MTSRLNVLPKPHHNEHCLSNIIYVWFILYSLKLLLSKPRTSTLLSPTTSSSLSTVSTSKPPLYVVSYIYWSILCIYYVWMMVLDFQHKWHSYTIFIATFICRVITLLLLLGLFKSLPRLSGRLTKLWRVLLKTMPRLVTSSLLSPWSPSTASRLKLLNNSWLNCKCNTFYNK